MIAKISFFNACSSQACSPFFLCSFWSRKYAVIQEHIQICHFEERPKLILSDSLRIWSIKIKMLTKIKLIYESQDSSDGSNEAA